MVTRGLEALADFCGEALITLGQGIQQLGGSGFNDAEAQRFLAGRWESDGPDAADPGPVMFNAAEMVDTATELMLNHYFDQTDLPWQCGCGQKFDVWSDHIRHVAELVVSANSCTFVVADYEHRLAHQK